MEYNKISVVINTYNAEKHLDKVLEKLTEFDEIVICDMESTDRTLEIARKYNCKIVTFPKGNYNICEPARNFAIRSASNDWVLVVDADELIPDTLRKYLYDYVSGDNPEEALNIPRINMFLGKEIEGTPDYQLRFFRKDLVDWPPIIHVNPHVNCKIRNLKRQSELSIHHLDDASISSRISKLNNYSDYEVPKRTHKKYGYFKIFVRPIWFFWKNYIFGKGYKNGKRGLINSYMASMYQIALLAKITEREITK